MNNSTQVVTLDGVAIPLVDPHNFQEFWNEREEERIRDSEKKMMYAEKVQSDSQRRRQRDDAALQSRERRDIETQYPGRNRIGTLSNSASTFDQPQQGAVSYLGEGTLDDTYYQQQQEQQQEQQQRRTIMDMNHRRQQQRQRPQSAQRQRSRQRRGARPASAHSSTRSGTRRSMSKTAPSDSHHRRTENKHRSRPQSAQPSKRRTRPKSARLSGTTGVGARRTKGGHVIPSGGEEDRRLVLENYQNSIKAQRRIRPTSSSEYIKLRAAKRRQQAKNFAESLKFEEKKRKVEVRAKVKEMNKWVLSNGDDVHYSIVEDVNAGAHGIIIHVKVSGVLTRRLIIVAFEKEHDRMKIEMDRKKAMRALSSHDSRTAQSSSSSSPQRNGAKNVKRGRSRHVVQRELVNILEDTETLTDTLVSQLKELRAFGWNVGYL